MGEEMSRIELKKMISYLEELRGRNTELISLYIPAGYNMREIINMLGSEQSEAQNIKSKQTRKNVIAALEKLERRLKEDPETPENGVALFCGNVSEQEGRPEYKLWEIVPPEPVDSRIYRCDKEFVLEPLADMVMEKERYGIICLDKNNAAVASLRGRSLNTITTLESNVPGKTAKGGQSAQRYARMRETMLDDFLKQIADRAKDAFFEAAREGNLRGIIIAGPGFVKEDFVDEGYLPNELQDQIIAQIGTNYAGEDGLNEVLEKAEDILQKSAAMRERKLVNRFFQHLKEENGKSTYGTEQVLRALNMGAVEIVLVSESVNSYAVEIACEECGNEEEKIIEKDELDELSCPSCGSDIVPTQEEDLVTLLEEKAEQTGADVEIISTETAEGKRLKEMGGIAAILRYRIE